VAALLLAWAWAAVVVAAAVAVAAAVVVAAAGVAGAVGGDSGVYSQAGQRRDGGFDQEALDEAARLGFANGAFEELEEDVQAVVEEFYPETESQPDQPKGKSTPSSPANLGERLKGKVVAMTEERAHG